MTKLKHVLTLNRILFMLCAIVLLASIYIVLVSTTQKSFNKQSYASSQSYNAQKWTNFPGSTVGKDGAVHFTEIQRQIVNQDGTGGQYNPPVNVVGSHILFTSDFKLTLNASDLAGGEATFRLYQNAPVIYDEWRFESRSIAVTISSDAITAKQWNGLKQSPDSEKIYKISAGSTANVSIEKQGKNANILLGGKRIISFGPSKIFDTGTLWLGADATGDGWTLKDLVISGDAEFSPSLEGDSVDPALITSGLGAMAFKSRPSLKVGSAVSLYPLMTDKNYHDLALSQFTMWTPENEMKAQFIHPKQNVYAFGDADALVDTALKNNIAVHGHALVFGEANAAWMQQTPANKLKSVMEDHIATIVGHYKTKVTEWDVVNEPLSDDDADYKNGHLGLRQHIWYKAMGEQYIANALTAAHNADPAAKLFINEYGLEQDGERWDAMVSLLLRLKAKNVPINGLGFQAHVYEKADRIDTNVLRSHMQQLASMGLVARISEIDVYGNDANLQAQEYASVFTVCKTEPNCTAFSTWGISDKYGSTTSDHTYPPEYGDDLLWDSNFKQKAAYNALLQTLTR